MIMNIEDTKDNKSIEIKLKIKLKYKDLPGTGVLIYLSIRWNYRIQNQNLKRINNIISNSPNIWTSRVDHLRYGYPASIGMTQF